MGFLDTFRRKRPRKGFNEAVSREYTQPWSGGDGIDMEHAVVIHAGSWRKGLPAQYAYISSLHGLRDHDWYVVSQEMRHADGRSYEIWVIRTRGANLRYYFDVTSFQK